ncbi:hypothetical protein, partial [Streptomyces sp. I05A-00742]|uniref:hypothetical protein n=1 Tax=Streptomyces sp. I05A-00742 TaxID=2732853 RepID=UPI001489CA3D
MRGEEKVARFQGDGPSYGEQGSEQGVQGSARPGRAIGTGRFTGPSAGRPRRAGVTVLAAALLGGLLGNAPGALAAPDG